LSAIREIAQSGKHLKQKREDLPPDLLVRDAVTDRALPVMTLEDGERAWLTSPWTT